MNIKKVYSTPCITDNVLIDMGSLLIITSGEVTGGKAGNDNEVNIGNKGDWDEDEFDFAAGQRGGGGDDFGSLW